MFRKSMRNAAGTFGAFPKAFWELKKHPKANLPELMFLLFGAEIEYTIFREGILKTMRTTIEI